MGRMSTVSDAEVFGAVSRRLASDGVVTFQTIVADTGVSVGSLYHRYGAREGLMARAWLDAISAFQERFLAALESDDPAAGESAALATPRFCRSDRERAIILACCRRSEFLSAATPEDLRQEIAGINEWAMMALETYAQRTGFEPEACRLGMVAFPLGAVRLYLPGRPVPENVDQYVSAAFRAVVGMR